MGMRSLSLVSLLFLFFSSCDAGDKSLKEASSLMQSILEKKQRHRYLKTTTTTSTSSGACADTGSTSAACCVTDMESTKVCCDGQTTGSTNSLVCTVKDLKFSMTGFAGTQCETCIVKYLKNEKKNKYEKCKVSSCETCPDGQVSYKCLDYDYQGC